MKNGYGGFFFAQQPTNEVSKFTFSENGKSGLIGIQPKSSTEFTSIFQKFLSLKLEGKTLKDTDFKPLLKQSNNSNPIISSSTKNTISKAIFSLSAKFAQKNRKPGTYLLQNAVDDLYAHDKSSFFNLLENISSSEPVIFSTLSQKTQQNRLPSDPNVRNIIQILKDISQKIKRMIQNALSDKNMDLSQIQVTIDEDRNINVDSDDPDTSKLIQQYSLQIQQITNEVVTNRDYEVQNLKSNKQIRDFSNSSAE